MKTLKRKNRKLALGVKIASLLSCVAIASVGFANWFIVSQPNVQQEAGSITAHAVNNTSLQFDDIATITNKINFGTKEFEEGAINHNWLQVSSTVGTELLSVTIPVSYYTQDIAAGTTATITVDFDGVTGVDSENKSVVDNSRLVYLIQKGYITLSLSANGKSVSYQAEDGDVVEKVPTNGASLSFTLDYATLQAATSERKGTFNIVVSFDWGKYTTYKNPYIYYNSVAKTPTWVEQATTILTDIYNAVSGTDYANPAALTYQVVVSATVNLPA